MIGHEGRDLMNGISVLIKGTPKYSPLAPSTMWGHSAMVIYEQRHRPSIDTKSTSVLIWDFLASRAVKNKLLLFISQIVYVLPYTTAA